MSDAARVFAEDEIGVDERVRWAAPAAAAAVMVWDEARWHTIAARELQSCREAGLLAQMVVSASSMATNAIWRGDFAAKRFGVRVRASKWRQLFAEGKERRH